MPFRNLLKKKEKIEENSDQNFRPSFQQQSQEQPNPPQIKFYRSDTNTEEPISPPTFANDTPPSWGQSPSSQEQSSGQYRGSSRSEEADGSSSKVRRSLSDRLHIGKKGISRSSSTHSVNIPSDLPDIPDAYTKGGDEDNKEAEWEQRATLLAGANKSPYGGPKSVDPSPGVSQLSINQTGRPRSISDAESDVNIQDAIRLHEEGQLEEATAMFKKLADRGNVISQVLYGLSLRHGWGCHQDEKQAFTYLASAASDSAALEQEALKSGLKKGGSAKGELVLAIFELGNCYRFGWGTSIDKVAARQYYECAGFMGDVDGLNEAAWCYLEGFGGKKDKFKAAQLLRKAEQIGGKTVGNSWIWKEKYNPK